VFFYRVGAHTEYFIAFSDEGTVAIAETASLSGASRGIIFRIKVQNQFFPLVVAEVNG